MFLPFRETIIHLTWILYVYLTQRLSSFFYVDDVVLHSKFGGGLHILLNKLHEFRTSSSLEVNISKSIIIIFRHNERKLNQKAFYLDKDSIELTRE